MMRRLGRETAYLMVGFPLALAAFVTVVTGLSVGAGLLITVIGLPVLTATAYAARGFAQLERVQIRNLLQQDAPDVRYRSSQPDVSLFRKLIVPLADPQTWLDLVHALVGFATATFAWSVAVSWWATAVGGLAFPAWGWAVPNGRDNQDLPELVGFGSSYAVKVVFYVITGLICAASLPFVIHAMTQLRVVLSRSLLSSRASEQQQVDQLVEGRAAARSAEAGALRRLERDIHDGPQQRLVRLSIDLGRAQKQAGVDNPQLTGTLDAALRQTQDTLEELRALSRGIAPPVLSDRGLRAALEELGARSSIPIEVDIFLPSAPLPDHVETAIYFVASEALTNVAKHSGASRCSLTVDVHDHTVRVRVTDDGRGGAHVSKGHGLIGLQDRVRAADGVLNVSSPAGGPTVIDAELPCES